MSALWLMLVLFATWLDFPTHVDEPIALTLNAFKDPDFLKLDTSEQDIVLSTLKEKWRASPGFTTALYSARIQKIRQGIAWWFYPSVVLYAIGWAIAWVRRGFR